MTVTTITPEIKRDRWDRPLILPKGGTEAVGYTRTTTFVGAAEDMYKISQWSQRYAVKGVASHDDLLAAARGNDVDNKSTFNDLVDEAKLRAGASDAAAHGTYLHAVTEASDRGLNANTVPLPTFYGHRAPLTVASHLPDLAAYKSATVDLDAIYIEQLVAHDPWKVAGTPDRVVEYKGKRYIADLKTGDIEFGAGKIAAQLAMYARSEVYDVATGKRDHHDAELDKGLVIHLPAGSGNCEVLWIDLMAGWQIALTCRDVRARRALKARDLYAPFTEPPLVREVNLAAEIKACTSREMVEEIWRLYESQWTPELTDIAKAHIKSLPAV